MTSIESNQSISASADVDGTQHISDQAKDIILTLNHLYVQPLVNLCGTAGNIINIVVFLKMGFVQTINISLLGLALSDLGVVLTLLWLNVCRDPFFPSSRQHALHLQSMRYVTAAWPHVCFARAGGMITAYIALERCIYVVFPLKVKRILTRRITLFVVVSICVLNICTIAPYFTAVSLEWMFFPSENRSLIARKNYEHTSTVENIVLSLYNAYSYLAVIVVLLCTGILITMIKRKSEWRNIAKNKAESENSISGKDRQVVVMVVLISIIFCIGYVPMTILFFVLMLVNEFSPNGRYRNVYDCLFAMAGLLESLNSSVNVITYLKMSTKYRETFYSIFRRG